MTTTRITICRCGHDRLAHAGYAYDDDGMCHVVGCSCERLVEADYDLDILLTITVVGADGTEVSARSASGTLAASDRSDADLLRDVVAGLVGDTVGLVADDVSGLA